MNCLKTRERGFTLIELLIVTVVIVTLMGIVFRLAGVGGDSRAQAKTLARLQRIENALSGYYAAYGSYPPVPLQGRSRSIDVQVDDAELARRKASFSWTFDESAYPRYLRLFVKNVGSMAHGGIWE